MPLETSTKIVALGEQLNIPVIAAGDVHFMDPEDEIYRRILMAGKGFSDVESQPLYFRTTEEMLKEFEYFSKEKAKELVIDGPRAIADQIETMLPIPKGTFPPVIEGSDETLRQMCYEKAKSIYGDPIPDYVIKKARPGTEFHYFKRLFCHVHYCPEIGNKISRRWLFGRFKGIGRVIFCSNHE